MNSVDAASADSLSDVMDQIKLIAECGIDFIEISGGSYENPRMMAEPQSATNSTPTDSSQDSKLKTSQRESFFLEFAKAVRENFPSLVLMVTGGFRTRIGMEAALQSGNCDLIGIGRPAAVIPRLPKEIILNTEQVPDEKAQVALAPVPVPFLIKHSPVKQVGAGLQSQYYASQIHRMGEGLEPIDTRIQATE
jgi:2,4-dienoyl-CoA reductase-like NADH-dependent reductase (Old Yellow Enzyme family)